MFLRGLKSKYESEVHIGFMAIVLILLFLNAVANYVLYQARESEFAEALIQVRQAGRELSRVILPQYPEPVSEDVLERVAKEYDLSHITMLPGRPRDLTKEARRDWFRQVTRRYPPWQYPELADKLFKADLLTLTRGNGREYYYLYPISVRSGGSLLVLSIDLPTLAYLDDARNLLLPILVGAVGLVGLIYLLVYRFMFTPFRRLRAKAEEAGREVAAEADEVEAVVEEYERTIRQLTQTKEELLRLNEEIQDRADSLELFNRCVMESGRSGVISLNPDGGIGAINANAYRLLDLTADVQPGADYRSALKEMPELIRDIGEALEGTSSDAYREYSIEESGRLVGVSLADLNDRERGFRGLLLIFSDLSELDRLRHELENRERLAALGEMAGGLAHQVRNSLGAIGGYATLLRRRMSKAGETLGPVESLIDEAREAGELITKFLSFSRPLEFTPDRHDLVELLDETLSSYRTQSETGDVDIRFERPGNPLPIDCDRLLLKQALCNIVDNAVKAADGSGWVALGLDVANDSVVITIEDSGPGIPSESLTKIFTPFYSSRPSGTGLGLPISAKIVDLHHGSINVSSTPGTGACFRIELPLAATAERRVEPSAAGSR